MQQDTEHKLGARQIITLVAVGGVVIATLLLSYQQRGYGKGLVTIGDDIKVKVRVAASVPSRERGLSGTESLAMDEGMLFLFGQSAKHQFWMKDMLIPLDAIWIMDGEIVDLTLGIQPPEPGQEIPIFSPLNEADTILEVPAGFAAQHGLRLGMPVTYRIDRRGALR